MGEFRSVYKRTKKFLPAHLCIMRGSAVDLFAFGLGKPSFRFSYSAVNETKDGIFESGMPLSFWS